MLHQEIKSQIITAMKAKDALRLSVLRGVLAAFTNELVATKRTPQQELADDEAVAVIRRLAKQRTESIEQFRKGGREELAEKETAERTILETFLPAQMSNEEIEKVVREKKEAFGSADASQAGKLVGAVMQELKGHADGNTVKEVVTRVLAE